MKRFNSDGMPAAEAYLKRVQRPGNQTGTIRLIREVKASKAPFAIEEIQGNSTVLGLAYYMGDRLPRKKPERFKGLFGLLYARRLPGEELYRGAAVFAEETEACLHRNKLLADGWTIQISTWELEDPLGEIQRVR